MTFQHQLGQTRYRFADLKTLLAKASPRRSGDELAGLAAASNEERVAAQWALAEVPLSRFLTDAVIPYEQDEVTRLILDSHQRDAFAPVASLTVGEFRNWLLSDRADTAALKRLAAGLTPEMVAAVSKIMRIQDLVVVAAKCQVTTAFRNTIGLAGRFSTRLQPNHPTDQASGIAASILDGLLMGNGDAVIGINPVSDSLQTLDHLLHLLDELIQRFEIPTQSCVLTHVSSTLTALERGWPVDLVFQSIAGTQAANTGFGIDLSLLREAHDAASRQNRGSQGQNLMYFETGQGSCLSADAHHGVDQQTLEARAYAVARAFDPLLVNTVVGFIGPEYLFDGKQIIRAGLEDHFCGKLLGLPMGCDICYTNHAEADQDDLDMLLTQFVAAGGTFIMGIPGSDDVMLNYQTTSFHDAAAMRSLFGKRPAPEFESWLIKAGITDAQSALQNREQLPEPFSRALKVPGDPWPALRQHTPARIGLGRCGNSLPTQAHLQFQQDHAAARDAVHGQLDLSRLRRQIEALQSDVVEVCSQASERSVYLQRPDLGRRLRAEDKALLQDLAEKPFDILVVVADGLSARGVQRHAADLLAELLPGLRKNNWSLAPVVLASQARVALADEIGETLGARLSLMIIGERPGLSAADSLGIYLTYHPGPGKRDAERNCISNIRPQGLCTTDAADTCLHLCHQALAKKLTGTALKDDRQTLTSDEAGARVTFLKP